MVTPDDNELDAFWTIAREHADLTGVPVYTGENPMRLLRPAAWAFGATPEQADELLALVLAGVKTATASAYDDYANDGEELPGAGVLSIILDGDDHPRALIVTTEVRISRFDQVDGEHARAEGEGDRSLEHWRAVHERFFAEHSDRGFQPDMPVVLERFRVLYPSI